MNEDLKYIIQTHIKTKFGINSNTRNVDWWIKRGLEDIRVKMLDMTNFLPADTGWSRRIWHIENDVMSVPRCQNPECDNDVNWDIRGGYRVACSKSCTQKVPSVGEKRKSTNLERFGSESYAGTDDHIFRTKKANMERYGDHPMRIESFIDKQKQTKKERYGDPNFANHDKARETKLQRYGDESYNNVEKAKATMQARYGVVSYPQIYSNGDHTLLELDNLRTLLGSKSPVEIAREFGFNHTSVYSAIQRHGLTEYITRYNTETEIENILKSLGVDFIKNDRTVLRPKELDFYIPEYNLAIEVNGIYWHSTASPAFRDRDYHFKKWKDCRDAGITLLSFTDQDIRERIPIIGKKLRYMIKKNKTVVGARKITVSDVSVSDERAILGDNHMQGFLKRRDGSLGAYYQDKLVAVINWTIRSKYLEITRFVTDSENSYPGLFSKMLNEMLRRTGYEGTVVSFSNNDHSNGNLYQRSGFTLDEIQKPAYWYTRDCLILENRQNYMKRDIERKFNVDTSGKTEEQLMADLGYHRYYDSGKIKWTYATKRQ